MYIIRTRRLYKKNVKHIDLQVNVYNRKKLQKCFARTYVTMRVIVDH